MAKVRDQLLQVECNQWLIFDDDDGGRHLLGYFAAGFVDQALQFLGADAHDLSGVVRLELLDRDEQKCLPRLRGKDVQITLGSIQSGVACCVAFITRGVQGDRINNREKGAIERDPWWQIRVQKLSGLQALPPEWKQHRRRRFSDCR